MTTAIGKIAGLRGAWPGFRITGVMELIAGARRTGVGTTDGPASNEARERQLSIAELLAEHGDATDVSNSDAAETALMDLFRRTASGRAFELLVGLSRVRLLRRVRLRTRFLGEHVDAEELLQDAYVNIYRYPDRFDASRPGAFRAWSTTIVDNAVRRHLRNASSGPDVRLQTVEMLEQHPDRPHLGPGAQAMASEAVERATSAYRMLLWMYLEAYGNLTERERFVLQMVEIRRMRYAELAKVLNLRPEALKMVVFRARKRIFERVARMLAAVPAQVREPRRRRATEMSVAS